MVEHISLLKKPILLSDLDKFPSINKVIIESIEQALYRVEVEIEGDIYYIIEESGKNLTRRSIVDIQELLLPFALDGMFLKHNSSYDEMIGQDVNMSSNELLVPLGNYFAYIDIEKSKSTAH